MGDDGAISEPLEPAPEIRGMATAALGVLSYRRVALVLAGTLLSLLLAALDMTIVATALPRIVADLGGLSQISWVITSYLIMSTTLMPVVGRVSDIYGRRPTFLVGISIFLAGSILSGLSQNMAHLIVFRGIQGSGAGFLMANTFTVIGDMFPPAERGKWQGLIGAVFGVASIVGPLVGGFLTDQLSWRWIFYVNVPVGAVALMAIAVGMPRRKKVKVQPKVDYLGAAFLILTLIPLLLALSLANTEFQWASWQVVGLLVFSAAMLLAFVFIERRGPEPILPISLFKNGIFAVLATSSFLTGIGMFGAILFIPLFVQGVTGNSATNSGLVLTPMMLGAVVSSTLGGQLLSRWSRYRYIALLGVLLMTLGMSLLTLMGRDTGSGTVTRNMVILGLGLGVTFPVFTIVVQNAFPYQLMGLVTASIQFFRSIGGALGVAIMGAFLAAQITRDLLANLPASAREALTSEELAQIQDPNVLVSPEALAVMQERLSDKGEEGAELFGVILEAMRGTLANALSDVFLIGAITVGITIFLLLFLKEIPLRTGHEV